MVFTQGQTQGRVDAEKIGVVAIFITGSNLIDPLAHHLDQGMFRMRGDRKSSGKSFMGAMILNRSSDLSHQDKTKV
jgi:hypothetical protein